jgi:tRNA U38,U39,U40 pseudouridine synthase TruA
MVRIMVGTLVHVGIGRQGPEVIPQMLAAKNRQAAGPTAPAHGLYLQWIKMKPSEEWAAATAKARAWAGGVPRPVGPSSDADTADEGGE